MTPAGEAAFRECHALLSDDGQERLAGVFLRENELLRAEVLAAGDRSFVSLRMRPIAERALACGADRLVIAHNHPSGDPRPSAEDSESTRRLGKICAALDIELVDHLIFAPPRVCSMRTGATSWL
ncbi:JAB domain-containing protein [Aurantiacibacter spongiae]|nr:JAB domain-containing protein [Aurantiacibacter spongiae]